MKFDSVMSRELDATASIDQAKELQVPGGHDVPRSLESFRNAVSFSSARITKRFPSPRCTSAVKIVRPSKSTPVTQPPLQQAVLRWSARSIVSFDRAFDNLGFLSNKFRQMPFYILRSQVH